jgi:hypothetical protein
VTSAKERFLENKAAAASFQSFVDSFVFSQGAEVAMLQTVASLSDMKTTNPAADAAAYQQILGARRFLSYLITVGVPMASPGKKPDLGTLDHRV